MQRTCSTSTSSSSSSHEDAEVRQFGPDKPPRNAPKSVKKESKLFAAMQNEDYDPQDCEQCNQPISFDLRPFEGTRDAIPHHLYWEHHQGKLPDYLRDLERCPCKWCADGRQKYF